MAKYLFWMAGGVLGGIAIGYSMAMRRHEAYFEERLDKATEDAKDFYRRKYEKKAKEAGEDPEFTKAAIQAAEALQEYQGISVGPSILTEELTETFRREEERAAEEDEAEDEGDDEEDDESPEPDGEDDGTYPEPSPEAVVKPPAPMTERRIIPGQPKPPLTNYNQISAKKEPTTEEKESEYSPETISSADFVNGDSGLNQSTVTYFHKDRVLANDRDQIISDEARKAILGSEIEALLAAGPEAMGGETTLYIRNTQVGREIEIVWSPGAYSDEVGEPIYATG